MVGAGGWTHRPPPGRRAPPATPTAAPPALSAGTGGILRHKHFPLRQYKFYNIIITIQALQYKTILISFHLYLFFIYQQNVMLNDYVHI